MGIVIRVVYNNQGWEGRCENNPDKDRRFFKCFPADGAKPNLNISPKLENGCCVGECWEQHLCIDYRWGCPPQGNKFGKRAQPGMNAFFVYMQPNHEYTLWGKAIVQDVNVVGEDGFYYLHFEPFKSLPGEKRIPDLTAEELVGEEWRQGTYRYVDSNRETYLERLIERGKQFERETETSPPILGDYMALNIQIKRNIKERLETASDGEGREIEDIVREAIAEWLKGREL